MIPVERYPLEDVAVLRNHDDDVELVMKDGEVFRNDQ
jgi:hypothetical protein